MITRGRVLWSIGGLAVAFLALQALPYGHDHTNPAGNVEPAWASRQARALVVRGCFDCHSNFTTWPWYSTVAPVSWLIQRDVVGGRQALNFSTWNKPQANAGDVASAVQDGAMPPSYYALLHPRATFSPAELTALIRALATLSGPTGDQARPPLGAAVRVATPGGATPSGR